uniref:Uncharacterized protein n=1 Tax=Rhizophora mucronata TaxID=61149 RepID=A0A2P2QEC6_RHIMU
MLGCMAVPPLLQMWRQWLSLPPF